MRGLWPLLTAAMQSQLSCPVTQRGPIAQAHLVEHIGEMRANRTRGNIQLGADFLVAESPRHELHDLDFASGQSIET